MNYFTIRDVENLSGIKAHTWRIWEQRYNLGLPQRKESNHRFYDTENLKLLLRISYLYHSGMKVSKIARYSNDEILELTSAKLLAPLTPAYYIKQLLEAALDLDTSRFDRLCTKVFAEHTTEEALLTIIYPYLERIGSLWLTDKIIPAQEHFTSNIIRHKLIKAIDQLPAVQNSNILPTVLFTPEKEHHEMPLLFIHYLMKAAQQPVLYLGVNITIGEIEQLLTYKQVERLHFHLITNLTNKDAEHYVQQISMQFPGKQVVMSGPKVASVSAPPANVRLLKNIDELLAYTKEKNHALT